MQDRLLSFRSYITLSLSISQFTSLPADRLTQHSIMFTARPPRAVSLYLLFMSAPV